MNKQYKCNECEESLYCYFSTDHDEVPVFCTVDNECNKPVWRIIEESEE